MSLLRYHEPDRAQTDGVDIDDIESPVMLIALESFGDAGGVQAAAVSAITTQLDPATIATFDTDALLDFRIRRPVMNVASGLIKSFAWPEISLRHARCDGRDVLLIDGPEPDRAWRPFIGEIANLAERFGATIVASFGSFPGPVPHTRPTEIATTTCDPELARGVAYLPDELEVPSSIHGAIEVALHDAGIRAVGLWAPVPQYAANQSYPSAAAALLERIGELTGLALETDPLREAGAAAIERLAELVDERPDHRRLVEVLEQHIEAMESARAEDLPSGDDLADDFRKFLEDQE